MKTPGGRIDGETNRAHEAFVVYRSEKSISKTLAKLNETSGDHKWARRTLEHWCSRYCWIKRLQEWEDYLDAKVREEAAKERVRWAKEEKAFLDKIYETSVKNLDVKDGEMSYSDILSYGKAAIEGRRRLCGDVDNINEIRVTTDTPTSDLALVNAIRNMSDEELEKQLERTDKIFDAFERGEGEEAKPK